MTCEYDPETCATAGELRAAGYPIPESVPDCGWIPRHAIRVEAAGGGSIAPDGRMTISLRATFTMPFQWIAVAIEQDAH